MYIPIYFVSVGETPQVISDKKCFNSTKYKDFPWVCWSHKHRSWLCKICEMYPTTGGCSKVLFWRVQQVILPTQAIAWALMVTASSTSSLKWNILQTVKRMLSSLKMLNQNHGRNTEWTVYTFENAFTRFFS